VAAVSVARFTAAAPIRTARTPIPRALLQSWITSAACLPLIDPRCQPGHYYLLNNYNPGYFGDGTNAYTDHYKFNTPFTVPPSTVRNIGDALFEKGVSFAYFGDQFNAYLKDKYQLNFGAVGSTSDQYCNICNFFQYSTSIMKNAAVRTAHLKDTIDLYQDLKTGIPNRGMRFAFPPLFRVLPPGFLLESRASRHASVILVTT
jgi:hypothetical protein